MSISAHADALGDFCLPFPRHPAQLRFENPISAINAASKPLVTKINPDPRAAPCIKRQQASYAPMTLKV